MKQFITILILSFFSLVSFGQKKDYHTKKGFIAGGYDVVSYFDNKAQKGSKEYTATYDGVKFKFVSKQHLNTFLKNPKKYIPQYGGYCAYALGKKNKKFKINPESFEIIDGKLYLFYDSLGIDTKEKWNNENPKELQKKADLFWSAYK